MMWCRVLLLIVFGVFGNVDDAVASDATVVDSFRNSIGQKMMRIQNSSMFFTMGYSETPLPSDLGQSMFPEGDKDEKPYHRVFLTPFYMSSTEASFPYAIHLPLTVEGIPRLVTWRLP